MSYPKTRYTKYESLLDAAAHLIKYGYRWDAEYGRFERGSFYAYFSFLKNGKCRVCIL